MAVHVEMADAQFENMNALRAYPFSEGSSLVDRSGKKLPDDLVVDVHLVVPNLGARSDSSESSGRDVALPEVRLVSAHISRNMVSVCFRSEAEGHVSALSATVSSGNFRPYFPYRLEKVAGASDIGGVVSFGNVEFGDFPETFFLDGAFVHPCCVSVMRPPALRRIVDPRSGDYVSGDVEIVFSGHVSASSEGGAFRLSLEPGSADELASECVRESGGNACGATPIRSINGIRPDDDGNIVLWFH